MWFCMELSTMCGQSLGKKAYRTEDHDDSVGITRRESLYDDANLPPRCVRSTSRSLDKFRAACSQKFFNRKVWRTWAKSVDLRHWINAFEVTYGDNGWHVHSHRLLFVMPGAGIKEPSAHDLLGSWQSACVSAGLGMPNERGLDIRDGMDAAGYVGKWGLDLEMTKAHVKKGHEGHRTPWDLLRDFEQTGDCESGHLFKTFAQAFKGKRQLVCSRGMRADLWDSRRRRRMPNLRRSRKRTQYFSVPFATVSGSSYQIPRARQLLRGRTQWWVGRCL